MYCSSLIDLGLGSNNMVQGVIHSSPPEPFKHLPNKSTTARFNPEIFSLEPEQYESYTKYYRDPG